MKITALLLSNSLALSACVSTTTPTSNNKPQTTTAEASTTAHPAAVASSQFVPRGKCLEVHIVSANKNAVVPEFKRVDDVYGRLGYNYAIFQRKDGNYIGVNLSPRSPVPNARTRVRGRIQRAEFGENAFYHPTAYCTTGEEIASDTGGRYDSPTSTGGSHLFVKLAVGAANMVRKGMTAGVSSDVATTANTTTQSGVSNDATAVTTASSEPSLVRIRNNGNISGNPSYVVDCSWGSKTILRKGDKWMDGTGHTFSDRTWGLGLQDFGNKLCKRQI